MRLCFCIVFSFKKTFNQELLVDLIEKTKQKYVLPILRNYVFTSANFALWMFKGMHDVFCISCEFLKIILDAKTYYN
jgi:hypothetical protein